MNIQAFEPVLAATKVNIKSLEDILWQVQLQHYPDSVRRDAHFVITQWANSEMPDEFYSAQKNYFNQQSQWIYSDNPAEQEREINRERNEYISRKWNKEMTQRLQSIVHTIQHSVGVFYECGLQPDGTYQWKGFRYGIEGSEYQSGFGSY
ncbi:hypothetical protein [Methylotenera sp.]|uniref:hypothetical protein n=1 Tax=Methylotenera sp. TaxID=2051956 RepID=UPI00248A12CB|nr:hypothetical protein [Methylotenera sp.]MDI1362544.1 hypothetical protein [Methylotenera sp.]